METVLNIAYAGGNCGNRGGMFKNEGGKENLRILSLRYYTLQNNIAAFQHSCTGVSKYIETVYIMRSSPTAA